MLRTDAGAGSLGLMGGGCHCVPWSTQDSPLAWDKEAQLGRQCRLSLLAFPSVLSPGLILWDLWGRRKHTFPEGLLTIFHSQISTAGVGVGAMLGWRMGVANGHGLFFMQVKTR